MNTPKIVNLSGGYHPALSLWLERPVVALRAYAEFEDAERDRLTALDGGGDAQVYLNCSGSADGACGLFVLVARVGGTWKVRRALRRAERLAARRAVAMEAAAEAQEHRVSDRPAAAPDRDLTRERAPRRPGERRLSSSKAQALHVAMGAAGFPSSEHKDRATAALGRDEDDKVVSFFDLDEDDDQIIRERLGLSVSPSSRRAGVAAK